MLALMSAGITPESALPAVIRDPIARLFRDHLDEVVSFLARRVRCPAAAEDLAQESYVRLLRRGTLPHDGNLPAYLRRIAERLAVDYLRQQRRAVTTWAPLSDDLPSPAPRPDAIAELRERCEIVLDAIADLPRRTRCVLLLRKVDALSYGDIAARLGIAEKTVQRHLVKAMLHCERRLRNPPLRRDRSRQRI